MAGPDAGRQAIMALDRDPYRTLGLTRGASVDEVKRAYRRLAKVNHPDAAGPGALPRFLAIQAAYEQLVGSTGSAGAGGRTGPSGRTGPGGGRGRPSAADADRAEATRRAYGGRQREPRPGADADASAGRPGSGARRGAGSGPGAGPRSGTRPGAGTQPGTSTRPGADTQPGAHAQPGGPSPTGPSRDAPRHAGRTGATGPGNGTTPPDQTTGHAAGDATGADTGRPRPGRGKATLGSTSYDGADSGPFEPDWGGASWYGTTSGTYWTINPKEYADPRKHGPEYQARARKAAGARDTTSSRGPSSEPPSGSPTHTTTSWWDTTAAGPRPDPDEPPRGESAWSGREPRYGRRAGPSDAARDAGGFDDGPWRPTPGGPDAFGEPAPDPARAAIDLARALTDPRSGGLRGRAVRAVLGWLPVALGLGWSIGELTGCGRFAATCDPAVAPLTTVGQGILLAVLFLLPEIAAIAAGAALVLIAAATAASLVLSATGSAADEDARRTALAGFLLIAWLGGLAVALIRRVRSGPRSAGPVS